LNLRRFCIFVVSRKFPQFLWFVWQRRRQVEEQLFSWKKGLYFFCYIIQKLCWIIWNLTNN
jgi:hypothetical protein